MGAYLRCENSQQTAGVSSRVDGWANFDAPVCEGFDLAKAHAQRPDSKNSSEALLARAIELEIIPRLMLVHSQGSRSPEVKNVTSAATERAEVVQFVQLLLGFSQEPIMAFVESWRQRGTPVEAIYLELLAPAARLLGDYWTEDFCDFTEVTVALGHLHRVLNNLGHYVQRQRPSLTLGLSIFLVSAPGEQHTFGLAMVGEFFRRAGWEVCGGPHATTADAIALLRKRKFDAVGFSLAFGGHLEALAQSILSVRSATRQIPPCIIAGGPLFASNPEYATRVQADLIISNGSEAPDLVKNFVLAQRVGA